MGEYTPPMEQFLMNALGESGIKKAARGVDAALCAMHALLVDRLQPELEMVAFRLGELRGLAANPMNRKLFNLRVSEVAKAEKSALNLLMQLEYLRDRVTQGVSQYRTFFSWLTTALRRFPEDTVDTMMGYPLSHVDTVRAFLHYEFDKSVIEPFLFGEDPNGPPQELFSPEKEPILDPNILKTGDTDGDTYDYWGDEVKEHDTFCEKGILEEIEAIFTDREVLDSDLNTTQGREYATISDTSRKSRTGMVRDMYSLQNEVLTALMRPSLGMSKRLYTPGRAETVHWMFVRKAATHTNAIVHGTADGSVPGVLQYSSATGELTVALPVEIPEAAAAAAAAEEHKKKMCLALMTCSARQFSEDPIYLEPTQSELEKAKSGGAAAAGEAGAEKKYHKDNREVKFTVTSFSEGLDLVDVGYYKDGALALLLENRVEQEEKHASGAGADAGAARVDAILALAPRDLFINTMHPVNITQLNSVVPAFEACGGHISSSPLDLEACRQRALPYRKAKRPMAISATRGIAFVLAGNQRAILYDLEEDEELDEAEEGEDDGGGSGGVGEEGTDMADDVEEEQIEEEKGDKQYGEGHISEKDLEKMSVSRMTQLLLGNDAAAAAADAAVPGGAGAGPSEEPQAAAEEESESEVSDDAPRLMARRPRRRS